MRPKDDAVMMSLVYVSARVVLMMMSDTGGFGLNPRDAGVEADATKYAERENQSICNDNAEVEDVGAAEVTQLVALR
ncbi:hypothetical protein HYQ46_011023 [Verticillium longisporum]|nr:hypothetical protein HYQ46_011023 [Verticillium longisporum]